MRQKVFGKINYSIAISLHFHLKFYPVLIQVDTTQWHIAPWINDTLQAIAAVFAIIGGISFCMFWLWKKFKPKPPLTDKTVSPPPTVTEYFLGRENEMRQLRQKLSGRIPLVLVNGIGGIGKTTLAMSYYENNKQRYRFHAWVTAVKNDSLEEALINQLKPRFEQVVFDKDEPIENRFKKILTVMMNMEGEKLLVIDNANNLEDLRFCLPHLKSLGWHILVTTRCEPEEYELLKLDELSLEDSRKLFLYYYKEDEDYPLSAPNQKLLNDILEKVFYNTLLVELLAKAARNRFTLHEIINKLEERHIHHPDLQQDIDVGINAIAIGNKITQLEKYIASVFEPEHLNENEKALLRQFALLPVDYYVFDDLVKMFLIDAAGKNDFEQLLIMLGKKGWLAITRAENLFVCRMHDMIQTVIKDKLKPRASNSKTLLIGLTKIITSTFKEAQFFFEVAGYAVDNAEGYAQERVNLADRLANKLKEAGNLGKAIDYFAKAIEWHVASGEQNDKVYARLLNNLGEGWRVKGNPDKAISLIEKALKITLKLFGEDHLNIAVYYNNLGLAWHDNGDMDKAINYFEKALKIDLKLFGEENPNTARDYNNLGEAWRGKGNLSKAINYIEKALKIDLEFFGEENPNTARDYNNLGEAWHAKDDLDKAISFHEKALEIDLKLFGEENPNTARNYNNLGVIWMEKGNLDKAESFFTKSLDILTKTYGVENTNTQWVKRDLAMLRIEKNKKR
ncbi:MAG TPA: tetratricopeptide repeat protein [Chitinophagales bacterium]|nr:tetratricopeptide repeat protein [Chitinophagales bacterium]